MPQKRFVITVGDSRVGKSTSARLLLDLYNRRQSRLRVFYHGHRNKLSMYQYCFNISHLGFSRGDSDRLLTDLESDKDIDVVLTDMPGQNFTEFKDFEKDVYLLKNLKALGYRITFLHPISHRKDCVVDYLQEIYKYFGDRADYIVVKNQYFGKDFSYYENSEIKLSIESLNGTEVVLGSLYQDFYQLLEETNLAYTLALENDAPLHQLQKSVVFNWMKNFQCLVTSNIVAANYLGLSNALAVFEQIDSKTW